MTDQRRETEHTLVAYARGTINNVDAVAMLRLCGWSTFGAVMLCQVVDSHGALTEATKREIEKCMQ